MLTVSAVASGTDGWEAIEGFGKNSMGCDNLFR
jgi:hypothetical protein